MNFKFNILKELPKIFGKPDNYESKEDSLDDKIVGPGEKLVEIIKSRRRRDAEQPAGKRRRGSKTRSKKRCPRSKCTLLCSLNF